MPGDLIRSEWVRMKQKNEIRHKESWNDGFMNKRHERFVSMRAAVAFLKQVFSLRPPSSVAEDLPLQMWWDGLMLRRNHNSVFNHRQACWRAHQRGFESQNVQVHLDTDIALISPRLLFCYSSLSLLFPLCVSGKKPVADTEHIMWQTVIATVVELSTNDPQMLKLCSRSLSASPDSLTLSKWVLHCVNRAFHLDSLNSWLESLSLFRKHERGDSLRVNYAFAHAVCVVLVQFTNMTKWCKSGDNGKVVKKLLLKAIWTAINLTGLQASYSSNDNIDIEMNKCHDQ